MKISPYTTIRYRIDKESGYLVCTCSDKLKDHFVTQIDDDFNLLISVQ